MLRFLQTLRRTFRANRQSTRRQRRLACEALEQRTLLTTPTQFDISAHFNIDAIANGEAGFRVVDTTQDPLDNADHVLVTDTLASMSPLGNGLPDDGFFADNGYRPDIQLGYHNDDFGDNAVFLPNQNDAFAFSSPPGTLLESLHLIGTSTGQRSDIEVTLDYEDGSSELLLSRIPGWLMEITNGATHGDATRYHLINDMDRATADASSIDNNNDASVFGLEFPVDPTKRLTGVSVSKESAGGKAVVLGMTGEAVPASTWVVDNTSDIDDGDHSTGNLSLREAVGLSNASLTADTIEFDPSIDGQDIILSGELNINDPVDIVGRGTSLTALSTLSNGAVFDVVGEGVEISHLKIADSGLGTSSGGGISNYGELTLTDVFLFRNESLFGGGAVFNSSTSRLTIRDSRIEYNVAMSSGGAILNHGTLIVENSAFDNNSSSQLGGAIFNETDSILTVTGSDFEDNSAGLGGAISSDGTLALDSSLLRYNHSGTSGGGLKNGGDAVVTASVIQGNTSNIGGGIVNHGTLDLINTTVTDNESSFGGGAIYVDGPTVVRNSTVANNRSASVYYWLPAGIFVFSGSLTLHNTIVADNANGTAPLDVDGAIDPASSHNLIGVDTSVTGIGHGTNGNLIGTVLAPIDPRLGPLQDNGGQTPTHVLKIGSPAIDAGDDAQAVDDTGQPLAFDQRGTGYQRIRNTVDIGAYETTNTYESVVGRDQSGNWTVARSDGTQFTNEVWGSWSTAITWADVSTADVNGDGYDDVVGRDQTSGDWHVALHDGVGSLVNQVWGNWNPAITWVDVGVADVDGDGDADVVGRDQTAGDWHVALSDGVDAFSSQVQGFWDPTVVWIDVDVADVNGDGNHDLVGRQQSNGAWWVGLSDGAGAFTNQQWGAWDPTITWVDIHMTDVNSDGYDDILGRELTGGDWWVAMSDGAGAFTNQQWGHWTPVGWIDVRIADLNGDGFVDIVGREQSNGNWWAAVSDGIGAFTNQLWGNWSISVAWVDIDVADVDGDGNDDIVGRDQATGDWQVARSDGIGGFTNEIWGNWDPFSTWSDVGILDDLFDF